MTENLERMLVFKRQIVSALIFLPVAENFAKIFEVSISVERIAQIAIACVIQFENNGIRNSYTRPALFLRKRQIATETLKSIPKEQKNIPAPSIPKEFIPACCIYTSTVYNDDVNISERDALFQYSRILPKMHL